MLATSLSICLHYLYPPKKTEKVATKPPHLLSGGYSNYLFPSRRPRRAILRLETIRPNLTATWSVSLYSEHQMDHGGHYDKRECVCVCVCVFTNSLWCVGAPWSYQATSLLPLFSATHDNTARYGRAACSQLSPAHRSTRGWCFSILIIIPDAMWETVPNAAPRPFSRATHDNQDVVRIRDRRVAKLPCLCQ